MNIGPPGRYDDVGDGENRFPTPASIPAQHQTSHALISLDTTRKQQRNFETIVMPRPAYVLWPCYLFNGIRFYFHLPSPDGSSE